jgi:curved DNA-binding protein CbpA
MQGASDTTVDEDGVPRLAPGWEARGARLSPAEGFLLSRMDGSTSWHVLRQIAGMPPEEVDRCIEQWLAEGLVVLESGPPRNAEDAESDAGRDQPSPDPELDLPLDVQEQVLAFEPKLEGPYHQILGVTRDADQRDIKRAYFDLSKLFHPDRYFGRDIGPFAERLDRIFKKVAIAYELLMDPATRAEVERSMAAAPPADATPQMPLDASGAPRKLTKRETLDRLRRQFRIPPEILHERRSKARLFHEAARVARHQQKWNEAASSVRLAIAFDPWTDEYKEDFAAIQAEVNQLRAEELLEEANGAIDSRSAAQALKLLEEAMGYRPSDAEVHARAAHAACEMQDFERAHEYAERACELAPGLAAHQLVRARSLRGQGLRLKAKAALEEAIVLEPGNEEVKEELRRLRKVPVRARGGKP